MSEKWTIRTKTTRMTHKIRYKIDVVERRMMWLEKAVEGKRVLFVTTKNLDYIRNTQEMELLRRRAASLTVIGSKKKSYFTRLAKVWAGLLAADMKKFDTIFVGFAPQLIVPFFRFKTKKKTIVIDFFISMYDTFVYDRKKVRAGSLPARIFLKLDQKTLKAADYVIADTKAHGAWFVKALFCDPKKLEVLYLSADTSIYCPMEQKKKEPWQDRFIVLYFGSILPLQGVDVVLEAIEKLKDKEELAFYVIGPLGDRKKPQGERIRYIDWLSQKELAEKIAEADLCLAGHFSADIQKAARTIPGKAYIYRAMKKNMILGENAANHELFSSDDKDVMFVKMGDADALAAAILSFYQKSASES